MNVIRRATKGDLPAIHNIQNIEFRSKIFIEPLPAVEDFVESTIQRIAEGNEEYFVQETDGILTGFVRLLKKEEWEALSWGKWLNTLVYACFVVSFDVLKLEKVRFAIREDNARVIHLYKKFKFRNIGQELVVYRASLLAPLQTISVNHYEITREEFEERREIIRKTSLELTFQVNGS
jgi:hypothetical protein